MVMKTHDRNSRPVRLQPRALRVRWPPIPGGRGLTYILYHIARCEIPSQTYYPLRSEACFLLECGVRSTITPSQEAHADFYAPACVTPPHQLRLCACYFTHSPNITVMDWTGHRQTFFFSSFFTNTHFDQLQGATSTCIPNPRLLTIDVDHVCSNVCTSDSALLVRAGYRRRSFGVTPYQPCCPPLRPSHQRGTIATDHFCIRSPPHPSPTNSQDSHNYSSHRMNLDSAV